MGFSWAFKAPKIMGSWNVPYPIGSMYGIYANIWGILMVNVTVYIAYMDPMGTKNSTRKFR